MATQVQTRRGTTAEHSTFTGAVGEVTIDTDKDTVVVHDGATAGGRPLLREDQSNLPSSAPTTGIYNASGALAISTSGTEQLLITSDRYVRLASGTGGIQFGGDTAATNALDDYEEGTWTPTVIGTSSAGTASYSSQVGTYTKIGNKVTVYCRVVYSGGTGTGNLRILGLPFTAIDNYTTALGSSSNLSYTSGLIPYGYTSPSNAISIAVSAPNTTATNVAYDSAASIYITQTYFIS